MKYSIIVCLLFFLQLPGFAQPAVKISGQVTDESSGQPIAAVKVNFNKSPLSTITNTAGFFELLVNLPDTLYFSAAGYVSRRIAITTNTALPIIIQLTRFANTIEEVTVYNTGYQAIAKERATGSFTQINNKTLNQQVGSNILSRLEGVASSVAFNKKNNTAPAISVRGLSTINGPAAPLIVLDNFPYEGDINAINPNNIESITILKDATAASIWGTRAGNGVIIINTKKGRFNKPLAIEFNSNMQVFDKPDMYYSKPIATGDYIDMEQYLFQQGYYNSQLNNPQRPSLSPVVNLLHQHARGLVSDALLAEQMALFRQTDVRDEMKRDVYRNSVNTQYSLRFSGGGEQVSWSASAGLDKSITDLNGNYQRVTALLENSFKPIKKIRISTGLSYTGSSSRTGRYGYFDKFYLYPYSRLRDANGQPLPVARDLNQPFIDTAGGGKLLDWNFYPATDHEHAYTETGSSNLLANLGINYEIGRGFTVDLKYQYERQQTETNNLMDAQSYDARNLINLFSQIDRSTGVVTHKVPKGGILYKQDGNLQVQQLRTQLNYNHSGKKHSISALAGNEWRDVNNKSSSFNTYGYNRENLGNAPVDFTNYFPTYTGSYAYIPGSNSFGDETKRFVSFYTNAAYAYNKKYSISISGRRDASNLFGANTNDKWTPLWSVGAGWNISQESFYRSALLPNLKLRATHGYTGNADPSRSAVVTLVYSGNSFTTGFPAARIRQFPNPHLQWEQVGITNVGLDFAMKNSRLSGSVEWYIKKGLNLFGIAEVDPTAGLGQVSPVKNVAEMKGEGLDILLNSVNIKRKYISWRSQFIFNYNNDKITKAYLPGANSSFYLSNGDAISTFVGKPVHSIISYRWAGLDPTNGDPRGILADTVTKDYGALTGAGTQLKELVYDGPALPQIFGSFSNTVQMKRMELTVSIMYKFHYFFRRNGLNYGNLFGIDKRSTSDYANRWQQPGDELKTDVPSLIYPANGNRDFFYNNSTALVEKGDHIRLQFINFSYRFFIKANRNFPVRDFIVFSNISNVGILWRANKKGIDPDFALNAFPSTRAYSIGLKANFQ